MKATMKDVFYHALLARAGYALAENKKGGATADDMPKLLVESKQSAMTNYLVSKFQS